MILPDWRSPVAALRGVLGRDDPQLEALEEACAAMEERIGELTLHPVRLKSKGGSRFPKRRNKPYRDWVKEHPCIVLTNAVRKSDCGTQANRFKIECCHIETKGSGGYDRGNCLPMCPKHHDEQEGDSAEFQAKYGLDLSELAQEFDHLYDAEEGFAA